MAHTSMSASHSIVGAKVNSFQSGLVDAIMAEIDKLGPHSDGHDRHFQIDSMTMQGIQRSFDHFENILIVRIIEIFQEKVVVQGYCIVVRDAVLADGGDQTIVDALQRAVQAAGEADAFATVHQATIKSDDRNPFENLMDEVRRVQVEKKKETTDESAAE